MNLELLKSLSRSMSKVTFLIFFFVLLYCTCISEADEKKGKLWVVLVSGYDIYKFTYGFEAGVYRFGQLLGGLDNENLILISPDTAAYHKNNPFAGVVKHGGSDYSSYNHYPERNITYNSREITTRLFFQILRGNKAAVKGIGQEKVVNSGPDDTILLIFINIGNYGVMTLSNREYLFAEDFIPFIEDLKEHNKFKKMLIYVDGHKAGSMFDNYLDQDKGILVVTNSAVEDELRVCHYDEEVSAYTSTCYTYFAIGLLKDLVNENRYENTTLWDYFLQVRSEVSFLPSVPQMYGQLDLGLLKLPEFFGPQENLEKAIQEELKHEA